MVGCRRFHRLTLPSLALVVSTAFMGRLELGLCGLGKIVGLCVHHKFDPQSGEYEDGWLG